MLYDQLDELEASQRRRKKKFKRRIGEDEEVGTPATFPDGPKLKMMITPEIAHILIL